MIKQLNVLPINAYTKPRLRTCSFNVMIREQGAKNKKKATLCAITSAPTLCPSEMCIN